MLVETATQERTARAFEPTAISSGDTAALSLGLTQRMIGPLTELSIAAAKEYTRLAAELQMVALEAWHDVQSTVLRRQAAWADGQTDPWHLYHRGCLENFESTRRAITLAATSARLVTQAADRLQTAAMDTGRRIRETLESSSGMRETTRR
jgi:hypothetical protein